MSLARTARSLAAREFLRRIAPTVRRSTPARFAVFRSRTRWSIAQLWFGNSELHYEAWLRERLGVVEVGLHFEADPLTNARLLAAFRSRAEEVRRALGDTPRIESWDRGWARVWEPVAITRLDTDLLERVASRLARYIAALESILEDELPADFDWDEPRARPQRAATGARAKQRR